MLKVKHVYKTYPGPVHALANVTFELKANTLTYLIGHSGAGKTTLFNILNGFEQASSGQVFFNDTPIATLTGSSLVAFRRQIGVIYQDFRLLPNKSLFENIALPLALIGTKKSETLSRTYTLAEKLGISDSLESFPHQVSGGEKQRAAIARALIHNPKLVIADEPTGSLDPNTGSEIFKIFHEVCQTGTSLFIATHNFDLIQKFPAPIIEIKKGQIVRNLEDSSCILDL